MRRAMLIVLLFLCGLVPAALMADALDDVRAGNQAFRDGQNEAAVAAFSKAIASGQLVGDNLALAYNNRGVALGELGDFDRAISDYQESLRLKSDDTVTMKNLRVAHTRRGQALANLGEQERALAEYELAISLDPKNPAALLRRAELFEERGEFAKAQSDLEQAQKLQPGDPAIAVQLTRLATAQSAARPAGAATQERASVPVSPAPAASTTARTDPVPVDAATTTAPAGSPPRPPAVASGPAGGRFRVLRDVHARAAADRQSESLGTIAAGQIYERLGETKGWILVELRNGKQGYVFQSFLERVAEE